MSAEIPHRYRRQYFTTYCKMLFIQLTLYNFKWLNYFMNIKTINNKIENTNYDTSAFCGLQRSLMRWPAVVMRWPNGRPAEPLPQTILIYRETMNQLIHHRGLGLCPKNPPSPGGREAAGTLLPMKEVNSVSLRQGLSRHKSSRLAGASVYSTVPLTPFPHHML